MQLNDKKLFLQWLTLLAESFNRQVSSLLLETYWQCLETYSFAQIKQAMLAVLRDTNREKWGMPTPGDLVRWINDSDHQSAFKAWGQVINAIRSIGRYNSVVFDNPLIHCVIRDMGGWMFLCQQPEKELPFLSQEFEKRYRDYQGKPLPSYPRSLKGSLEHDNQVQGTHIHTDPVLIGNPKQALNVYANGIAQANTTSLSLSQAIRQFPHGQVDTEEEN